MAQKSVILNYLGGLKKLSSTELLFMEEVWNNSEGISSEKIYEKFPQSMTGKSSILAKVCEKGYLVKFQKGRHYVYYPKISKLDYERALIEYEIQKTFKKDSFESLIAAFCGKKLSNEKCKQIKDFFKELEKDD